VSSPLHTVIVAVVGLLLARSAVAAWRNRTIAVTVWRRVRPRHVLGSIGLIGIVVGVALTIATLLPVTQFGLGDLVGVQGNAVFAPIEDVLLDSPPTSSAATPSQEQGTDLRDAALVVGFCLFLLALLPWLAYVEEQAFRAGLEHASMGRQASAALRFGLAHLVMLIPLAAALAIAVAGFAYGVIYRRAYARVMARAPAPLIQTDRFASAAGRAPTTPVHARTQAILASTVWHTTFNSVIVLALLVTVATTLRQ
jgi:membrane protease YdiL (CAAX protease family)